MQKMHNSNFYFFQHEVDFRDPPMAVKKMKHRIKKELQKLPIASVKRDQELEPCRKVFNFIIVFY